MLKSIISKFREHERRLPTEAEARAAIAAIPEAELFPTWRIMGKPGSNRTPPAAAKKAKRKAQRKARKGR